MRNRRGYRRFQQERKAVSPVVATLILILIAVAAAAALYLWLVAWQGGVTGGIGSPSAQSTITIGGSTSVYPFDQLAVAQFQQNNSNIVVSDNQGGSGAGMIAVCHAAVDIGATSSLQTPSNLEANYGCPQGALQAPVVTTVAYDGVDLAVQNANPHGLISMSADTLLTIYIQASSTAYTGPSYTHLVDGVAPVSASALTWNQIPACNAQATGTGCAGGPETATTTGATVTPCAPPFSNDICAATTTPCGWTVCAGGANNPIATVTRSDPGGTVQSFTARLLGIGSGFTLSGMLNNWGGCGSDGQLGSCGISTSAPPQLGNPGVIGYIASHPDALGFASDGLMRVSTSGVICAGTATAVCGIGFQGWDRRRRSSRPSVPAGRSRARSSSV